jgi:zinc transport system substrate-binding protein
VVVKLKHLALAMTVALFSASGARAAETAGVVVTIKPLHALVSGVIGDTGKATLLVTGNTSPHGFKFKPSQMTALNNAKIVFLIDEHFETFMESALDVIPQAVIKSAVIEEARLKLLPFRKGGVWEEDDHKGHDHGDAHGDEANLDMHAWLDPDRAIKMVKAITRELSDLYPENRDIYKANARAYIAKIKTLDAEIAQSLAAVNQHRFIVFHDAYQYFETKYNLKGAGSITLDPHDFPSPKRLTEIRAKLAETAAACVFREPQFSDRLVKTVIQGTEAKIGILDPLGADIEDGSKLYFALLRQMASNFKACFDA